jgi:phosphate transport system substrate-binding protein
VNLMMNVVGMAVGLLVALVLACSPQPVRGDVLEIPGTGACELLLKELAAAFNQRHPGQQVIIPPSVGTVGGMRLVTSDQAVIVRVAQPLKEAHKGLGLTYLPFSRDPVVFVVGPKVPVRSITGSQLADIFSGRITSWQALGGPPALIRLLVRQPEDSSLLIIQQHLEPFRQVVFDTAAKVLYTDPDMLAALQKYDFSIGWLPLSALQGANTPIHPLALDGMAPTPENVQSQRYRLVAENALVFKKQRLNDLAKTFIDFVFSREGQEIIKQLGAIPIEKD